MEDDITTPDLEVPPEPTDETQPDPAALAAELEAERERIKAREAELQRGFDKVARKERELEERFAEPEPVDDTADVDPETLKLLEGALGKTKFAKELEEIKRREQQQAIEIAERELARYAEKNNLDPDKLREVIAENNLTAAANTLNDLDGVFEKARRIQAAASFDPEKAEQEAYQRALQRLRDEGVHIEAVEPKAGRAEPGMGKADFFDEDLTPEERYALVKDKKYR